MENQNSFLETWKEVINKLKEDGLISQEEYDKGVQIPLEWLYSTGIDRETFTTAMRNLYQNQHPQSEFKVSRFKKYSTIFYCEKEGKPTLEITAGKNAIFITDEKMPSEGWSRNVTSNDLALRIAQAKKQTSIYKLMNKGYMSKTDAIIAVELLLDNSQMQSDLYAMPHLLSEMALNFGEYYRYMDEWKREEEKLIEEEEKNNSPIEIQGGIVDPALDSNGGGTRGPIIGTKKPRKSEISDFQQRDEIFRNLNPERIIKFDGIDRKTREIIRDAYTCYVYKNPQSNRGYLTISEPFEGDKEAQVFYLTEEFVKDLQNGQEDLNEFWKELTRTYIEDMTREEFKKESKTTTLRHVGTIEEYREKIEGIVNGIEENSQKITVQRIAIKLFDKYEYKDELRGITRSRYNKAKAAVFEDRENDQTKEEGETIDE